MRGEVHEAAKTERTPFFPKCKDSEPLALVLRSALLACDQVVQVHAVHDVVVWHQVVDAAVGQLEQRCSTQPVVGHVLQEGLHEAHHGQLAVWDQLGGRVGLGVAGAVRDALGLLRGGVQDVDLVAEQRHELGQKELLLVGLELGQPVLGDEHDVALTGIVTALVGRGGVGHSDDVKRWLDPQVEESKSFTWRA